jgi:opacity protein-like surface antigen
MKAVLVALLMIGAVTLPARAQSIADADPQAQASQRNQTSSSHPAATPISLRAFGFIAEQAFSAKDTFDAVLGSSSGPFFGGGGQVVFSNGLFAEVSASRFSDTGERAFISGGQSYSLGIPVKITITPVEFAGGYRFHLRGSPLVPYVGAGVGSYGYSEESNIGDPSLDISVRHTGVLGMAGVEVRVQKWIALDVGAAFTHIPGILGEGGLSKETGEDDLGGASFRFRVTVGR